MYNSQVYESKRDIVCNKHSFQFINNQVIFRIATSGDEPGNGG